jgi:hypothetical protein
MMRMHMYRKRYHTMVCHEGMASKHTATMHLAYVRTEDGDTIPWCTTKGWKTTPMMRMHMCRKKKTQ